ncbi:MAG: hypothetical protein JNK87_22760 [Bryobacterales bacterium]|nr:hypothetical protein [Bryobacterales bacterium]
MISEARAQAARKNGARSQGPKTTEGKARSSQNGFKHGLRAKDPLLHPEEKEVFEGYKAMYFEQYQPETAFESHLISRACLADFLSERARKMQLALIDLELCLEISNISHTFEGLDEEGLLAAGFQSLVDRSNSYASLDRHLARLQRESVRTLAQFEQLRAAGKQKKCTSEPKPDPTPLSQAAA